jgi:hypothetical protein
MPFISYSRRRLSSSSLIASEAAGNNTAAASKAAATKPAGVVRTAALTERALPIARSNVAFIPSGCGAAVSDWFSAWHMTSSQHYFRDFWLSGISRFYAVAEWKIRE